MKGFGTVVTGTLVGGPLAVGDAVEVWPSRLRGRVRGLQCFGAAVERADPGARCAVNLQGLEVAQLSRGDVVAPQDTLAATEAADVEIAWRPEAPPLDGPASVEFLTATAERRARLAPIAGSVAPGAGGFARVHLDGPPLPLLPGDRFVVRGFARTALGGSTLGGGRVLDPAPPRRRLSDPALARDLALLAGGDLAQHLRVRIARAGLSGVEAGRLRLQAAAREDELAAALERLRSEEAAFPTAAARWLSAAALGRLEEDLLDALRAFHAAEPLRPGVPRGALRGRLPENVAPDAAELALARLAERGAAVRDGDLVRAAGHRVELAGEDRALADRLTAEAEAAGLEPPLLREWEQRSGADPVRLREVLAHLERSGVLVRAPGDVFFAAAAVEALRGRVAAHLREHGELRTPEYKALIGTTRKWAVPLMELFDAERLTRRRGEVRVRGRGPDRPG
jgi:selenocysteine-specific elongation factor